MAEERKGIPMSGVPADFDMEDEQALNDFIGENAFETFVESIGEAFTEEMGSDAGSSALLTAVMADHLSNPAAKADFTVDLMQKDDMLLLGLLGDEFERLSKEDQYQHLSIERVVEIILGG